MLGATVPIEDLETLKIPINIEGLSNDDLSDPGQGICGVTLTFRHDQMGDISIQLVSPSGQVVDLIGPTGAFGATDFTTWDVSFLPCSDVPSPDPGFSNNWNNGQNWGVFGNYSGSYFPFNGCLEDFDTGSANGEWTIIIRDGQEFDDGILLDFNIVFCDPDGIECTTCTPEPGDFVMDELNACQGDSILAFVPEIEFPGTMPNPMEYGYTYIISIGDSIVQFTDTLRMDTFPSSVYEIRGLSYALRDSGILMDYSDSTIAGLSNTITSTDTNICAELAFPPMSVNIYRIPEIQIDGDSLSCANEQAQLRALTNTPFSTYIWTDVNGVSDSSQSISTTLPGNYTITVFSNFGCMNDSVYELIIDTVYPILDVKDTILACPGDIFTPEINTNAPGPQEWILPFGDTIRQDLPLLTGVGEYVAIARARNGCFTVDTLTASTDYAPPDIVLSIESINCENDSASLSIDNSMDFASVTITDPIGRQFDTSFLKTDFPGSYLIDLVTSDGCTIVDTAVILADTVKPELFTLLRAISCENGEFELNATWPDPDAIFEWIVPGGGTVSDPTIQVNVSGLYVSVLTASNQCSSSDSIEIPSQLPGPELEVMGDTLECRDTMVTLEAVTSSPEVSILWSGPGDYESMESVIQVGGTGLYVAIASDSIGCQTVDSFQLIRNSERPSFTLDIDGITCVRDTAFVELNLLDQGSTSDWSGEIDFSTEDNLSLLVFESGSLDLRIDYAGGCIYDTTILIIADTILPDLQLETMVDGECTDQVVVMNAIGSSIGMDYRIFWDTENGNLVGDPFMTPIMADQTGVYTLSVTDLSNGCSVDTTFPVEIQSGPDSLSLIASKPNCADASSGTIEVRVFGGRLPYRYSLNGGPFQEDPVFSDLPEGDYMFNIIDSNGCEIQGSISLDSQESFTVDAGEDQILSDLSSALLLPFTSLPDEQISNSSWTLNGEVLCSPCDTFFLAEVQAGIYVFTVRDSEGCTVSDFLEITILSSFNIFIPSAFSPNGDGINDAFELFWTGSVLGVKEIYVFNRWGDKVFEFVPTEPVADPIFWDGTFNGKPCQDGLYMYYIVFATSEGVDEERRGEVQIIR